MTVSHMNDVVQTPTLWRLAGFIRQHQRVLPTGMLDFSFCIRYIRPLISTDVVALDGGGHHDVSTAQSSQNPAGPLPEPTTGEGVA